jgi:hypothetical protein
MWEDWVSRMSGIFSLIFIAVALGTNLNNRAQAKYWAGAAVLSYIIASFWVWYKHRPDLTIEQEGLYLDAGVTIEELDRLSSYLTVPLYLVNTCAAQNSIRRYELTVEIDGSTCRGNPVRTDGLVSKNTGEGLIDLDKFKDSVLIQGWPSRGWVRFLIADVPVDQILNKRFTVTVTDAYKVKYRIKGHTPPDIRVEIERAKFLIA